MKKRVAFLGSVSGIIFTVLSAVGAIYVRRVFVQTLGVEYMGITAIFSSVFGMLLSLDCGIASSLFLRIYEPIARKDTDGIKSAYSVIKMAYLVRAVVVTLAGGIVYFFLPYIVGASELDLSLINRTYILYALLTGASYYLIFFRFFLEAAQKKYIVTLLSTAVYPVMVALQVLSLKRYKSYVLYLLLGFAESLLVYWICRMIVHRKFPYLKGRNKVSREQLADFKGLLGMAFHIMGNVLATYTDTFLITGFTGVAVLGTYDNYKSLGNKVKNLLDQVTTSIKDPMRILMAEGNIRRGEDMLNKITFFLFWISGQATVCLSVLTNPFIRIWLGDMYTMDVDIILTSSFTIYLSNANYILIDAYYYTRNFVGHKRAPIIEILVNLAISFVLGYFWGISGVMIGTIFYYILQTYIRGRRLYTKYFKVSFMPYIKNSAGYAIFTISVTAVTMFLTSIIEVQDLIGALVLDAVMCVFIFNLSFWVVFRKSDYFDYFVGLLRDLLDKILHNRRVKRKKQRRNEE